MSILDTVLDLVELLDSVTEEKQEVLVENLAQSIAVLIEDNETLERLYLAFASDNLPYLIDRVNYYVEDQDEDDIEE